MARLRSLQARRLLSFVEYCTWIVPGVLPGKAALISFHEHPLFFILTNFVSSSGIYLTLVRGHDVRVETLEEGAIGRVVGVVGTSSSSYASISRLRSFDMYGNLNSRLYVVSFVILVCLRKP
jgi:hypothetical protein